MPGVPGAESQPGQQPAATPGSQPESPNFAMSSNYGAARGPESSSPNMLGDFFVGGSLGSNNLQLSNSYDPLRSHVAYGNGHVGSPITSHTFKMADAESAFPRTRVFFVSNYFSNVDGDTQITRQMLGVEKQVLNGRGSIGFRLPFFTAAPGTQTNAAFNNPTNSIGTYGAGTGSNASIGDLTLVTKYVLYYDPRRNNILSGGLVVVTPTGPQAIGGVTPLFTVNGVSHSGSIQPYVAFFRTLGPSAGPWFLQGFTATDTPFNLHDATFLYNDVGLGYISRRNQRSLITAFIPTVEGHVNVPLNNTVHGVNATPALATATGGAFDVMTGTMAYSTQVNLTAGATAIVRNRTALTFGVVAPLASPTPYNVEFLFNLNHYVGNWVPPFLR